MLVVPAQEHALDKAPGSVGEKNKQTGFTKAFTEREGIQMKSRS